MWWHKAKGSMAIWPEHNKTTNWTTISPNTDIDSQASIGVKNLTCSTCKPVPCWCQEPVADEMVIIQIVCRKGNTSEWLIDV